jgi:hypothetical protein
VYLNDKYALDGRDPNSYSGIGWVFGRHDRPWAPERPVFGRVRYMTSQSAARKLRLKSYLARYADGHYGQSTHADVNERARVLHALLAFQRPLDEILREFARFSWDADEALVTLTTRHVVGMLHRFVRGEVSAKTVEDWANAIEGRDDIAIGESASGILAEAMFALANPALEGALDLASGKRWLERLER